MANSSDKTVRAGVIGTGQYATATVTQAESIPNLDVPIVADTNIEAARNAYELAGYNDDQIVIAENRADALFGIEAGKKVVVQDALLMMDLPIDVIAEGTGSPSAGAVHAVTAMKNGKHVVMITKETDMAVGTGLRRIAKQTGQVYTAADGDQPSHLISLIEWCQQIGLEVLCGGKFGEKHTYIDLHNRQIHFRRGEPRAISEEEAEIFRHLLTAKEQPRLIEVIAQRKEILGDAIDVRTDDLTEQGIVANATGLSIERERFHHPVIWVNEMPAVLAPETLGGILEGRGVIEQCTYLRSYNDTSMGGGVYATVHASNDYSKSILSGKGHIANPDGTSTLIFRPYHLCGVETPYSILTATLKGIPTAGENMSQNYDSYGRAKEDLPAGTDLRGAHDDKWETFLAPATKLSETANDTPIPYHIATGYRLTQDVSAGTVLTQNMVENVTNSPLWKLRVQQDSD